MFNVYNCNYNANKQQVTDQINTANFNEQSLSLAFEARSFHL